MRIRTEGVRMLSRLLKVTPVAAVFLLGMNSEVKAQVLKASPLNIKPVGQGQKTQPAADGVKLLSSVSTQELALMLEVVKRASFEHGLFLSLNEQQILSQIGSASDMEAIRNQLVPLFASLARQLYAGRLNPTDVGPDIRFQKKTINDQDLRKLVADASGSSDALIKSLVPQMPEYRMLVMMLAKLRQLQTSTAWGPIAGVKKNLKLGVKDASVVALKQRLLAFGYKITVMDDRFDKDTENAVYDVQQNLKQNPDKVVSPRGATLAYLETSLENRIQQVRADLEKMRWLPQDPKDKYIFVNLAFTSFTLIDRNQANPVVFNFRTINGRVDRKTPSMADKIYQVILNPYWVVPPTVFVKDKVELIKGMDSYQIQDWFDRNHFKVISQDFKYYYDPTRINWFAIQDADVGFYIQQLPNYYNALGVVKFALTNGESIYLHDTGERHLFKESNRLRSSGCVRLEKPLDLAEYLLKDTQYHRELIEDIISRPDEEPLENDTQVKLKNNMPVYMIPMTSHMASDSVLRFTTDVYEHNQSIQNLIQTSIF